MTRICGEQLDDEEICPMYDAGYNAACDSMSVNLNRVADAVLSFDQVFSSVEKRLIEAWESQDLAFEVPAGVAILALEITNDIMKMQGSRQR